VSTCFGSVTAEHLAIQCCHPTIEVMRRRSIVTLAWVSGCVLLVAVIALVGWASGLFRSQVAVTVVNDVGVSVDLTCAWDNRDDLRPDERTVLPVDDGSAEDCEVDAHDGSTSYGCLVLDARGALAVPHEVHVSEARTATEVDCSV
jgi:hypothetical protein